MRKLTINPDRLREVALDNGLETQRELAQALNVPDSVVSRIYSSRGTIGVSAYTVRSIHEALGVPVTDDTLFTEVR